MSFSEPSCCICHNTFIPSKYAGSRQLVCANAECRREAKKERQAKWVARNADYFQGPENVERVSEWRRKNPDWRERKKTAVGKSSPETESCNTAESGMERLQDSVPAMQHAALMGLMSFVTGSVLQDEVQNLYGECLRRGSELLQPEAVAPISPTT
jgi:hypothetical protein